MRTHGWGGDPPADDDQAIRRILDATRTCIDRDGAEIGIVDVARQLGVSRPTVYRYYRTTDDLLTATAIDASAAFLDVVDAHLSGVDGSPAGTVVEGLAFTLEQLPRFPYLALLLEPGRISVFSQGFTSPTAMAIGRSMLDRFPVDWSAHGLDDADLDGLVEHMLRLLQSLVIDPGTPARDGTAIRDYLTRWLAPAVDAVTSHR